MKSLRARFWLPGTIAVSLLFTCLVFWIRPHLGWGSRNAPSVSTIIRALQTKDSRLNDSEVVAWSHLPLYVQQHFWPLQPIPARERRRDACKRLATLGPAATNAVPYLIRALDDSDNRVRFGAIEAIRAIGPPARAAKGRLLAALKDPAWHSPTNRFFMVMPHDELVATTLAALAPQDPEVVSALLELIAHPGGFLSPPEIAKAWIQHAPEPLSVFKSVRRIIPRRDSWGLVSPLIASCPDSSQRLSVLLTLAEDPDYGIRYHAVRELGALGALAAGAVPKLVELFGATEQEWEDLPQTAQKARFEAYTVFVTGMPPQGGAGRYSGVAATGVIQVRVASPAAPVLAAAPPSGPGAAMTMAAPITHRVGQSGGWQPPTRRSPGFGGLHHQVILTLGEIGSAARDAIPCLVREYQDPTSPLRFEAAMARAQIDGDFSQVMPVLAAGLEQAGPELRARLLICIARMTGSCGGAVTLLIKALADSDTEVWLQVLEGLEGLGPKAAPALPLIMAALDDREARVRIQAIKSLGALGSYAAPALPRLLRFLGDPNRPAQFQAISSLGALGSSAVPALPALRKAAGDPEFPFRTKARSVIETIQGAARSSSRGAGSGVRR